MMSAAEEEAFMLELGDRADLRKQYEEELLIGAAFAIEKEEVTITNQENNKPLPGQIQQNRFPILVRWLIRYRVVALLVLSLISVAVVLAIITIRNNKVDNAVATDKRNDFKKDTLIKTQERIISSKIAGELFRRYYKSYSTEKDPVELSIYYNDYKAQRYDEVIKAKETDFQVKGSNEKRELLNQYMQLYQGLCYLEKDKPVKAIPQLEAASQSHFKKNLLFYDAQWYLVLAWLKNDNAGKAGIIAGEIVKSTSPHRQAAAELISSLKSSH
jgi:hypothetical protein